MESGPEGCSGENNPIASPCANRGKARMLSATGPLCELFDSCQLGDRLELAAWGESTRGLFEFLKPIFKIVLGGSYFNNVVAQLAYHPLDPSA